MYHYSWSLDGLRSAGKCATSSVTVYIHMAGMACDRLTNSQAEAVTAEVKKKKLSNVHFIGLLLLSMPSTRSSIQVAAVEEVHGAKTVIKIIPATLTLQILLY